MSTESAPEIRNVSFVSQGYELRGRLFIPAGGAPSGVVLLLPGFPGNEEDVLGLGQRLMRAGIGALMFNYRGTYHSEGDFSLPNAQEDIAAAHAFLMSEAVPARFRAAANDLVIGGHSFGGGMAFTYAANHPQIRRAFSIAGTDHAAFQRLYDRDPEFRSMVDPMFESLAHPQGPVRFAPSQSRPDVEVEVNMEPFDLQQAIPALADRRLFFLWGWDDLNNRIEDHMIPLYRLLVQAEAPDVRIATFATDHGFGNVRDEIAANLVDWIRATPATAGG